KGQEELEQEEVDNAKQELALAGGDAQGRIEELMKEHEAASRIADSTTVNAASMPDVRGLVQRYLQWSQLHNKKLELRQASQEAEKAAALFTTKRDTLESNIKTRKQEGAAGSGPAPPAGASFTTSARATSPELVRAMKRRSALVKDLTNLNERVEDQNRLESNEGIKHCAAPNL